MRVRGGAVRPGPGRTLAGLAALAVAAGAVLVVWSASGHGWLARLLRLRAPEGPVWEFFAVVVVIVAAPPLFERVRVPGIIGLLAGGLLIGPQALALVPRSDTVIAALGELGLLYLMFLAGLELDLEVFRRHRRGALLFALLTFSLPMVFGFGVSLAAGFRVAAATLIGSLLASHTLVAYPVVRRYGLTSNRAVATAVGTASRNDRAYAPIVGVG